VVPRSTLRAPEQRTWQGPQPHSSPTTLNAFAISVVPNPWAFSSRALSASIEEADPWSRPRPLPWRCPQAVARGAGWSRTRRTHRASRGSTCRPRRRCQMGCSVAFNGAPRARRGADDVLQVADALRQAIDAGAPADLIPSFFDERPPFISTVPAGRAFTGLWRQADARDGTSSMTDSSSRSAPAARRCSLACGP
jgi:hypothetical protein